jgi:MFS transporter, ACS family, glucarate transporter
MNASTSKAVVTSPTTNRSVDDDAGGEQRPTNVRLEVLALACSLSMITYLDRVCFGAAGTLIARELGLPSEGSLAAPFTAFAIAYGVFEIPSGWWGDVRGPRKVLIRIVVWWSLFTAITGLVGWRIAGLTLGGLTTLTVVRFLFGAGEAGAYPNIARALHNWFPAHERGSAQGWVWMSGRLMGGLTPLIWMLLVSGTQWTSPLVGWRTAFWLFGLMGVGWCFLFAWRFRDRPEQHPKTNDAERKLIAAGRVAGSEHANIPWLRIFGSGHLVWLYLMYFCATYGWYFNITYLAGCLETRYGVPPTSVIGSIYKGGPLWLGAAGCLLGGYLTDGMLRRGVSRRWSRRLPGMTGHLLCAGCCVAAAYMPNAFGFFLAISFAAFFNDLMMGGAWATCQDVGGRYTAILAGCMNTVGSLGAASAGWFSGAILNRYLNAHALAAGMEVETMSAAVKQAALSEGYTANLLVFAAIYLVAAVSWFGINPDRGVETSE